MNRTKSNGSAFKRVALGLAFMLVSFTAGFASPATTFERSSNGAIGFFKPSAAFKEMWIQYDVKEGRRNGMRIHVKFSVYGMRNLDSYLAIYFMDEDGDKLPDRNGKYNSSAGEVAVYYALKPGYATTDYDDLSVFMPYDELDLPDGDYNLKIDADVIYKNGGLIDHLTFKDIVYNQG